MEIKYHYTRLSLLLILLFALGCQDDGTPDGLPSEFVNEEMSKWRSSYGELQESDTIRYSGEGYSIIKRHYDFMIGGIDCLGDGVNSFCQLMTSALTFETNSTDEIYYLTITLLPHSKIVLNMEPVGGIGTEIFRKDLPSGDIDIGWPGYYTVNYVQSYSYNDEQVEGFVVNMYADERPPFFYHSPKRFIFLAEYGVIEWDDYAGNTFYLLD